MITNAPAGLGLRRAGLRATRGGAGAGPLQPWHVPQGEQAHHDSRQAGPDPPSLPGRDLLAQHQQDHQSNRPARGDDRGHELVVGFKRWRRRNPFVRHESRLAFAITLAPYSPVKRGDPASADPGFAEYFALAYC